MRSVVVSKFVPSPVDSGDKRRTLGLLRALRDAGEVTVCAFAGPGEDPAPLEAEGIRVRAVPLRRTPAHLAQGVLRGRSLTAARFWSPELAAAVREECRTPPDVLVSGHVQLHPYLRGLTARTRVCDMQNVESSLVQRTAEASSGAKRAVYAAEARALRALEASVPRGVDLVTVVSQGDRDLLARTSGSADVLVVPNAWEAGAPLPPADGPVACFVALLSWTPNVDAATWFGREVWPRVTDALPGARLLLVGKDPAPEVRALAGPTVEVTGTVPDVGPYLARSRVALAPLRVGGGSRMKILEALAAGRPVVATPVGVEGLEDLVGRGVVVAEQPQAVADAVVALLRDAEGATDLGLRGSAAVTASHSWAAATAPLVQRLRARAGGTT